MAGSKIGKLMSLGTQGEAHPSRPLEQCGLRPTGRVSSVLFRRVSRMPEFMTLPRADKSTSPAFP